MQSICDSINAINWSDNFRGRDPKEMVQIFTEKPSEVFSLVIPNKIVKFNDKDR